MPCTGRVVHAWLMMTEVRRESEGREEVDGLPWELELNNFTADNFKN